MGEQMTNHSSGEHRLNILSHSRTTRLRFVVIGLLLHWGEVVHPFIFGHLSVNLTRLSIGLVKHCLLFTPGKCEQTNRHTVTGAEQTSFDVRSIYQHPRERYRMRTNRDKSLFTHYLCFITVSSVRLFFVVVCE